MEYKIYMIETQIEMVHKLTLGLHLIIKRIGLCMPNKTNAF